MKKNIFQKISLNKIWTISFTLILVWIIFLCILDSKDSNHFNPILLILLIILFISILTKVYKLVKNKFKNMKDKHCYIYYIILTIMMIVIQFIIGYLVRTNPTWDLGICITAAKEILSFGHMTDMAGYFTNFPNNIFLSLLIAVIFKISSIFGLHVGNGPLLILNIFIIQLALYFMFQIVRKLFGNFQGCFVITLAFLVIPFYTYAPICYTDTLSMFIPVALIFLFMKIKEDFKTPKIYLYSILIGILIFLAIRIKITALIPLIAIIIVLLFNGKIKRVLLKKRTFLAIIIILFCYFSVNFCYVKVIDHTNVLNQKYKNTGAIPFTHWLMMGTYDMGAFSSSEYQYTLSLPDYESRVKGNLRVIKQRLKNWKTQGYIKFLNYKMSVQTWQSGTYDFENILISNATKKNYAHEFFTSKGKYFKYVYYYCQVYHFSMLVLIIISLIYSLIKKEKEELTIMKLSMFGLLIFLLLWETRSRYMLNFIPIYLIIMLSGIDYLSNNLNKIKKIIME